MGGLILPPLAVPEAPGHPYHLDTLYTIGSAYHPIECSFPPTLLEIPDLLGFLQL